MDGAVFADRIEAGRALGDALESYAGRDDVVVLALPRGGVPVGFEIARRMKAPLDVIVVRKLGVPGHEELAMGAVASGGTLVRNEEMIEIMRIDDATFDEIAGRQLREVREREFRFRGGRDAPEVKGKVAIVVDDGIATGSTFLAALQTLRQLDPGRIVVAAPVAPPDTVATLSEFSDEVVCLQTPTPFYAVGSWYRDFQQVPDKEVHRLLDKAASTRPVE